MCKWDIVTCSFLDFLNAELHSHLRVRSRKMLFAFPFALISFWLADGFFRHVNTLGLFYTLRLGNTVRFTCILD